VTSPLLALFRREFAIARRIGGSGSMGVVFMLMLVTILPFAIGPDLNLLRRIGPAILWIAALLAMLLGLDRLFQADFEDGSLDQLQLGATPLEFVVLAALPLVIAAPLFGVLMAQEASAMLGIGVSLLVGTPALTFIGAVGAAATVSLRRGGLLMALLVLPLCIPALIFGVSAATAASGGTIPFATPLAILAALTLAAGALCPFAAAALLRRLGE
jgi:heme exporter protein B